MNLLMLSPHLPAPTGGACTRSYYLLKALARNYRVSLLALNADRNAMVEDSWLTHMRLVPVYSTGQQKRKQQLQSVLRGRSYVLTSYQLAEVQRELDDMLAQEQYDAVIFESIYMAGYRLPAGVRVIIDQHNIEYELLQRTYQREKVWLRKWYNWWESQQVRPVELERCRRAHTVLVTSQREALLLKQQLPTCGIEVVPNGVDTERFDGLSEQQEVARRVVFTGTMNYYPNIDAALFFARRCWPLIRARLPDAEWQIVGKSPPPQVQRLAELPGVMVVGEVPDIKPYIARAAVAIAPLLIGSGTRLKILEALAMRKAMVSTSLGCEGLLVQPGKHLVVANEAREFAEAVVDLLLHPEKRAMLGAAGKAFVDAEYSWERCGMAMTNILERIVR